jgi:type I restriction enzyme S subunit
MPNHRVDARFLTTYINQRVSIFIETGGIPQLTGIQFSKYKTALPPLPEQRAIAKALSDVDELLGGLDRLITKKRDLKQAAMQQLLTGQTRLPGFHGEWDVKRLGDVIHLIRGGIYGEEKPRHGLRPSSVATTAHIEQDDTWNDKEMPVRYFTEENLRDYATVEGDLIVVKSSGSAASIQSGKLGFIDTERAGKFVFSNFLMLLRPTAVLPRFLYFYLCSHNVKKLLPTLVEASTYPNIRLGDYLAVEIPVPPLPEQTAIASVLTDMDAELAGLEQRREKTRALKQAMMQELLTGRIRLV